MAWCPSTIGYPPFFIVHVRLGNFSRSSYPLSLPTFLILLLWCFYPWLTFFPKMRQGSREAEGKERKGWARRIQGIALSVRNPLKKFWPWFLVQFFISIPYSIFLKVQFGCGTIDRCCIKQREVLYCTQTTEGHLRLGATPWFLLLLSPSLLVSLVL